MNFALSFVLSFLGSSHTSRKGAGDARASYWPSSFESSVVNTAVVNHLHRFTLNHAAQNGGSIYSQSANDVRGCANLIQATAVSSPTCTCCSSIQHNSSAFKAAGADLHTVFLTDIYVLCVSCTELHNSSYDVIFSHQTRSALSENLQSNNNRRRHSFVLRPDTSTQKLWRY